MNMEYIIKRKYNLKNKGFTLIELLAVILILGIIALIAIPTVTGVVTEAKKNTSLDSVRNYINAVDNQIITSKIKDVNIIEDGIYTVEKLDSLGVEVKNSNKIDNNSIVLIEDGQVRDYSFKANEFIIDYDNDKEDAKVSSDETIRDNLQGSVKIYKVGYEVYFNPISGFICSLSNYNANADKLGNTGCLKWYIISNNLTDNVDLILDHNTTKVVMWSSDGINSNYSSVIGALYNKTNGWIGLNFINKQIDGIDYTNYYARLITANEVAKLVGKNDWNSETASSGSWFFLESKIQDAGTVTGVYGWLYDNTNDCLDYGCYNELIGTNGYWTSSPIRGYNQYVWQVGSWGDLNGEFVSSSNQRGVRPVITIKRELLN